MGRRVAQGGGDRLQGCRAGRRWPGALGLGMKPSGVRDLMWGGVRDSEAGGRRGLWLRGKPGRAVMGHGQVGAKVEQTRGQVLQRPLVA